MRSTRWVVLMMVTVAALGCAQTNGRDEVTRESLCIGLDPASVACALEVLARIDRDGCEEQLACEPALDPRFCDVYYPEQGSASVRVYEDLIALVRLGRLRVDLDAAVCVLRSNSPCEDTEDVLCDPILIPTANFTVCTRQEECGRDGYCADTGEPFCTGGGLCRPRLTPGAVCSPGAPCAWDQACLDGLCRTLTRGRRTARLGASCGLVVEGETYYSELCVEGATCSVSFSSPSTCVPVVSEGASCGRCPGPDCAVCGTWLRCLANVCVATPLPREGDPCNGPSGVQGFCDSGTYGLVCEEGLCVASQSRIGDVCGIPCAEGYCARPDDTSGPARCMATRRPNGASCTGFDQCENGLCCGGVCVPVPE